METSVGSTSSENFHKTAKDKALREETADGNRPSFKTTFSDSKIMGDPNINNVSIGHKPIYGEPGSKIKRADASNSSSDEKQMVLTGFKVGDFIDEVCELKEEVEEISKRLEHYNNKVEEYSRRVNILTDQFVRTPFPEDLYIE